MAKIMIYEDSDMDLIGRYADLNKKHDVSVCLVDYNKNSPLFNSLKGYGFDLNKITYAKRVLDIKEIPQADVYFTDGLGWDVLNLLNKLPKNKTYLLTADEDLQKKAKEKGYKLATGDLEKIIQTEEIFKQFSG